MREFSRYEIRDSSRDGHTKQIQALGGEMPRSLQSADLECCLSSGWVLRKFCFGHFDQKVCVFAQKYKNVDFPYVQRSWGL
jgi:hypothetical protein